MLTNPSNSESTLVDPSRISVRKISMELAKEPIEKRHYLRKWSSSKICFGVFKDEYHFMGIDIKNRPIGALVYGYPVRKGLAKEISPLLKSDEVLELKRLWIEDGHGKNIESFSIAESFRLLRKYHPEVKILVSYADPAAGHRGTIYQATNWKYQKLNNKTGKGSSFAISLTDNPKPNEWIHSRTAGRTFGKHSVNILKRKIGRDFLIRWDSEKYRYIYFLSKKPETKRLLESVRHPIAEKYTNEMNYSGEVEKISVEPEYRICRSSDRHHLNPPALCMGLRQ